jgi:hypothetical protein
MSAGNGKVKHSIPDPDMDPDMFQAEYVIYFYQVNNKEALMHYVDGFVIPMPKKNLKIYARMARKAADRAGLRPGLHGVIPSGIRDRSGIRAAVRIARTERVRSSPVVRRASEEQKQTDNTTCANHDCMLSLVLSRHALS